MTEHSYYHNGAAAGDAIEAPYSSDLFCKVESLLKSSGTDVVFPFTALPYAGELVCNVTAPGTIQVGTGAALVGGILYTNDAGVNLTIPANNSIYARMDRVVIRVDWATQTATAAIKTGRPALLPEPPDLTQIIGDVYEMTLCRYYLAAGGTTTTGTNEESILDERVFANTAYQANSYTTENHFPNSEFMSRATSGALATGTTNIPAMWEFVGTPSVVAATKFDQMFRGMCIDSTVDAANYIHFDLEIAPGTFPNCTIQMYLEVISGTLTIGYGATVLRLVDVTNGPVPIIIRTVMGPGFELRFSSTGTCRFKLGQITATHGRLVAPFGVVHETVLFGSRTLLDSATTLSDGNTAVSVTDLKNTQAVLAQMVAKDTLSSTNNTNFVSIRDTLGSCDQLRIELGRRSNSFDLISHGIVGILPSSLSDPDATYQINYFADAVGTLSAIVYRVGIVT